MKLSVAMATQPALGERQAVNGVVEDEGEGEGEGEDGGVSSLDLFGTGDHT